jgi:hypothetical protein
MYFGSRKFVDVREYTVSDDAPFLHTFEITLHVAVLALLFSVEVRFAGLHL